MYTVYKGVYMFEVLTQLVGVMIVGPLLFGLFLGFIAEKLFFNAR